jgi:two-component system sensor histidine kinase KdpD
MIPPTPKEVNLVTKHGPISAPKVNVDRTMSYQDSTGKDIEKELSMPEADIYEDKHGLPVLYENTVSETKSPADTDTNNISVLWHELISPLTLIKGYTATLLQLRDSLTEEQELQYIQGIDTASNRVIRLLENIRDITRLEEADALTMLRVSLPDIIKQVASDMQNQTNKHVIKVHLGAKLPLVSADPEKIEMVITNLLTNAIKYSPQGGDIEIETKMVKTDLELRKTFGDTPPVKLPSLVVSIADGGEGIPEAELDRIFEKFYRVKNRLTQTTPGAGLGLHICKIIIKAHKGHIWAKNGLQGGSIFCFSLPL